MQRLRSGCDLHPTPRLAFYMRPPPRNLECLTEALRDLWESKTLCTHSDAVCSVGHVCCPQHLVVHRRWSYTSQTSSAYRRASSTSIVSVWFYISRHFPCLGSGRASARSLGPLHVVAILLYAVQPLRSVWVDVPPAAPSFQPSI